MLPAYFKYFMRIIVRKLLWIIGFMLLIVSTAFAQDAAPLPTAVTVTVEDGLVLAGDFYATPETEGEKPAVCRTLRSGGTRIRTGDTMIFSHVLYQLSYPAGGRERFYGTG